MNCGRLFAATAAAVLLCAGVPAMADSRLVTHEYDADEVVRIDGKLGVQATIGFEENEAIENVAVGDSQTWQITPNKRANLLFVKPLEAGARTNMTVVTNKRTYFFDLVASAKSKPIYMLRFTYGEKSKEATPDAPPPAPSLAALNPEERAVATGDPVAAPADAAMLNFAWSTKGDSKLLPKRVYDDGAATYLLWESDRSVPAILVRNEKGEEGPVNYAVRGDTIVIDDVPSLIILRTGEASATLQNLNQPSAKSAASIFASDVYIHPALAPDKPSLAVASLPAYKS